MTLNICLRCDWRGETEEPRCPNCGVQPLYVVGASAREVEDAPVGHRLAEPISEVQSERTRRSLRSTTAAVSVALLLIVVVAAWLNAGGVRSGSTVSTAAALSPSPTSEDSSPSRSPPSPRIEAIGSPVRVAPLGTQSLTVQGVPFSFRAPSNGWWRFGDLYVSKSTAGSQDAEAVVFFATVWRSRYAVACGQWWGSPVGSLADWATEASRKRGTELVEGPLDVTIGGYAAKHVVFTVRKDVACNPGFFHRWKTVREGPFWGSTVVGDTIRIWLVEVGGTILYIEGDTHDSADAGLEQEVDEIVASIVFD
jgi:hypothetical protein